MMRVSPVTPATSANNDLRGACQYAKGQARKEGQEPATRPQSRASIILELYGAPATFGTFERYGNFSAKV
jgi:hypothetical protein